MKKYINLIIAILMPICILAINGNDNKQKHTDKTQVGYSIFSKGKNYDNMSQKPEAKKYNRHYKASMQQKVNATTKRQSVTAYYKGFIKVNGWWKGQGKPLTKEETSHLNFYFKFSRDGSSKHWQHIEARNGYGNFATDNPVGTYIINPSSDTDIRANKDFVDALKTVCMWDIISDKRDKDVIEERAYDANKNLVFSYHPVRINKNTISGFYLDRYGCPIESQNDSIGNATSIVHITYDKLGHESLVEFFDNYGYRQKNMNGAYMTKWEHDKDGNLIREASCNIAGKEMIDEYGNCGYENKIKNGFIIESNYFDDHDNPIRVAKRVDEDKNVIRKKYKYDKWGRLIELSYWNSENKPDTNAYSAHKTVYSYNEHGLITDTKYYDLNDKLTRGDSLNIAEVKRIYNKDGYEMLFELKDKNGKYINNFQHCCKETDKYDKNNNCLQDIEYSMTKDSLKIYYSFDYNNNIKRWEWYNNNYCEIDTFNNNNKIISKTFYDCYGKPIKTSDDNYHKCTYTYKKIGNKSLDIYKYFDVNNNPINIQDGYYEEDLLSDPTKHCIYITQLDSAGNIIKNLQHEYNSDFSVLKSETSFNKFGKPARTDIKGIPYYYKVNVASTVKGNFSSFSGENEFGEPAYITTTNNTIYYYMNYNNKGNNILFDENCNEIKDMNKFIAETPYVYMYSIEDSIGYKRGLKDGDVLLRYGDWWFSFDSKPDINRKAFSREIKNRINTIKDVIVLRHHPESKTSEVIALKIPAGPTAKVIGPIYYTQKEKKRLEYYYYQYLKNNHIQQPKPYTSDSDSINNFYVNHAKELSCIIKRITAIDVTDTNNELYNNIISNRLNDIKPEIQKIIASNDEKLLPYIISYYIRLNNITDIKKEANYILKKPFLSEIILNINSSDSLRRNANENILLLNTFSSIDQKQFTEDELKMPYIKQINSISEQIKELTKKLSKADYDIVNDILYNKVQPSVKAKQDHVEYNIFLKRLNEILNKIENDLNS